jgi:hypothetical protein
VHAAAYDGPVLPAVRAPLADAALAHPLTQPYGLPISPLLAAVVVAGVVFATALASPPATTRSALLDLSKRPTASWVGSLSAAQWLTRLLAVILLTLAIAAGRLGVDDELENLAPALIIGTAWPVLVLASCVLGAVWRWTDPWDAVARGIVRLELEENPRQVWTAALVALPWVWYLSAYSDPLGPRPVGAILALYTLLTVAGCLAVGRARWLGSSEPLGILLSWMALLPRRRLADWDPPPGAEALLGVLAGGVLFGAVRRSELWGDLNTVEEATLVATVGLVASCGVFVGLLTLISRAEPPSVRPAVARAAVPAVAGIIVAVAMDRNRLFTSVQLLPGLIGDPFGQGWDLFGQTTAGLDPAPLGTRGLLFAQLAVLLSGWLAGAIVFARRVRRAARLRVAIGLATLAYMSVIALATH